MDYYQIIPLKENIYRITSSENVFMELLVGEEKALLIDTGYGFGDLYGAVCNITDKPLIIVNTHGHVDHTCGNFRFPQEAYLADADLDLLQRHNTRAIREHSAVLAHHTVDYATGREFDGLPEDFDEDRYLSAGPGSTRSLEEGMVFDLGGMTLRTIATPGHTRGSMSLYYEEESRLYVGDAANIFLWLFGPDAADKETYLQTLDKIEQLCPKQLYGGHSPVPYTMEDVRMFRKAALEADYDRGIPFSTPLMPEIKDIRVCVLGNKTMADIGQPGFYAILLDQAHAR